MMYFGRSLLLLPILVNDTFNEISNLDKMCFILSDNRLSNISGKACYGILTARTKLTHPNDINVNK